MKNYLSEIEKYYGDPLSSEMSYRTPFQNFLESIFKKEDGFHIQHDSKTVGGNKPDFIIVKNGIAILYIEVKKVGENLDKIEKSSQATRYFGYTNLIISDYINFRFYRNGERQGAEISLAKLDKVFNKLESNEGNLDLLCKQIFDFPSSNKEPIKSGQVLAKIMGGRAQRIKFNVLEMLKSDSEKFKDLHKIKKVIHESLIKELDDEKFADMYAQTLVYGLFVARYNDKTQDSFSRGEALTLLNKSNPFLYDFFSHIAGTNFPDKLRYIVDELCEIFSHADIKGLMHDYFKSITLFGEVKHSPDPVIHFYEDFLKEYDTSKKMEMGVFYTPKPVVEFIIRGVDEILKKEFGITKGLADTSKTDKKDKKGNPYHKVQILDVATGTGTFLNSLVEFVHQKYFVEKGQSAGWADYVKKELLPRLNGFELMVASYTIAHLKLSMTLEETGVNNLDERLRIFLTNTLDEPKKSEWDNGMLFVGLQESITNESIEASKVKSEYPIMCVVGNPPYSGESMNPHYIDNDVYKVEIGGKEKLKEKNSKWINDDYVKFIRFSENLVEKNGEGIVAMITAHGYIENPTFRGMRWHLRETFDKIYILDLHGNSRKKETKEDGGVDQNVFDIMTGVSIFFGVKKINRSNGKKPATVYKADLFGKRAEKLEFLHSKNLIEIDWAELSPDCNVWILEGEGKGEYDEGFSLAEIFPINSVGIVTSNDSVLVNSDKGVLLKNVRETYKIEPDINLVQKVSYRPFDTRFIYFDKNIVERSREKVMNNFFGSENIGLVFCKQIKQGEWHHVFVSNCAIESSLISNKTGEINSFAPGYLYSGFGRHVNLTKKIVDYLYDNNIFDPGQFLDSTYIIDYIYAVLHSPRYREKYNEFLKKDFPRVPFPKNKDTFWNLVSVGEKLRNLHLMKSEGLEDSLETKFDLAGSGEVVKPRYENKKVYVNETQFFDNVPEVAWDFYIGGYQPAQKWLKDRKGRVLSYEDIIHYQKIIKILVETDKLMGKVDKINFL